MSNKNDATGRDPMEDKGWQQMKTLLDQEMPSRKRVVAWWYWAGAAAVVTMIAFVGYSQIFTSKTNIASLPDATLDTPNQSQFNHANNTQITIKENDQKIEIQEASEPLAKSAQLAEQSDNKVQPENITKVQKPTQDFKRKDLADGTSKNLNKDNKLDDHQKELSTLVDNPSANEIDISRENSLAIAHESEADLEEPQKKDTEDAVNESDQLTRRIYMSAFISKPVFYLSYQPTISLSEKVLMIMTGEVNSPIEARDKGNRFSLSAEAALISETQLAKWSYDAGAGVRYAINDVFSIGSGAYFWQIANTQQFVATPNTQFNDNFDLSLVTVPELEDLGNADPNNVGKLPVVNAIDLNYLRIPLFVQFFPNGKLQPRIGVNQLFLMSNNLSGAVLERQNTVASPGAQSERVDDIVRKSNLCYELGLTFQPKNHIYLDLSYQHGRASYLNYQVTSEAFHEYHRSLRLAAGFRF